jgi:hypothetical protein
MASQRSGQITKPGTHKGSLNNQTPNQVGKRNPVQQLSGSIILA